MSANSNQLIVPPVELSTFEGRAFSIAFGTILLHITETIDSHLNRSGDISKHRPYCFARY